MKLSLKRNQRSRAATRLLALVAMLLGLTIPAPEAGAVPSALTTPGNMNIEATSASGATVSYTVTSSDPGAKVTCSPSSGSVFGIGSTTVACSASGSSASFTVTVNDTTAPVISGAPGSIVRNVNGVRSAVVTYKAPSAHDAVDGNVPVDCKPASGSSFPLGSTPVSCTAVDQRGNAGSVTFDVRLVDKVAPPDVTDVVALGAKGFVRLSWRPPPGSDFAGAVVVRNPGSSIVYEGNATSFLDRDVSLNGHYQYLVASYDWAGNRAKGVTVFASAQVTNLIEPPYGATLKAPPLLVWKPAARADYYNVQLWVVLPSGPVKIFSSWPRGSRLQLDPSWTFGGQKHRLAKGHYRWYVWPGIGLIADAKYGSLIGTGDFVIG
jgi:hypothetical protein